MSFLNSCEVLTYIFFKIHIKSFTIGLGRPTGNTGISFKATFIFIIEFGFFRLQGSGLFGLAPEQVSNQIILNKNVIK